MSVDDVFRQRLLDGLAVAIAEDGYQSTTVAGIVRRARTSRRTFYAHFASKEECFIALLAGFHERMIRRISAAVDRRASHVTQVRQAIDAWLGCAEREPAIALSLIRDLPALDTGREVQRDMMTGFVAMVRKLCDTEEWQAVRRNVPVSRQLATLLIGGLRELIATTVEEGGRPGDITEIAVHATVALLGAPVASALR